MDHRPIHIEEIGPGFAQHDVLCWLCNERPAVYDMNPTWVFRPCWECQERIGRGGTILFRNRLPWPLRVLAAGA